MSDVIKFKINQNRELKVQKKRSVNSIGGILFLLWKEIDLSAQRQGKAKSQKK